MRARRVVSAIGLLLFASHRADAAPCVEKVPAWCSERGGSGIVVRVVGQKRADALLSEILLDLDQARALERKRVPLEHSVCRTYQKALRMPGGPDRCATRKLAARLNPGRNLDRVGDKEEVVVPDIQICLPGDRSGCTEGEPLPIYDLYVRMPPDEARAFARRPRWLREGKVAIDGYGRAAAPARSSHAIEPTTVEPYLQLPPGKQCERGVEASLVSMIAGTTTPLTDLCTPLGTVATRALVSIVDHSQVTAHHDLDGGWPDQAVCDLATNPTDADHATGLKGIIKARADERGLVGLYPEADVRDFWWKSNERAALDGMLVSTELRNQPDARFKVALFATDWLRDEEQGLTMLLANEIDDDDPAPEAKRLWIAASGKPDGPADRILKDGSALRPGARGRQSNVLVVTGCEQCLDPVAAHLIDEARSSPDLVHVAAPAALVPTTARDHRYRSMRGTSAAVPFVGAMAALLTDCFPMQLKTAADVKERLQFTSRPLLRKNDGARLAAGIVDPKVAFLDPAHVHLKRHGSTGYETIDDAAWCQAGLAVLNPDTGQEAGNFAQFNPMVLDRIVRVPDPQEPKWVFFRTSLNNAGGTEEGRVIRVGPGTLGPVAARPPRKNEKNALPLLRTATGELLSLSEIDDLVGRPRISTEVTDACQAQTP